MTGWSIYTSSVTNTVPGTITASGQYIDDTSTTTGYWSYYPVTFTTDHIYYESMDTKVDSLGAGAVSLAIRNSSGTITQRVDATTANSIFTRYSIRAAAGSLDSYVQLGTGSTSVATTYIKNIILIDLTTTFGDGNEPSQAWCDANLSYFDGTQDLNLSP